MPEEPNRLDRDMFRIERIGECKIDSPLKGTTVHFTTDDEGIVLDKRVSEIRAAFEANRKVPVFEAAGPREKIFHDPRWSKAAILTAGGLCPGLNSVIKSLTLTLKRTYGVPLVYGIPYGFAGLNPASGYPPVVLDESTVDDIHEQGGTILGSSRGMQDTDVMLETLVRLDINILFCVGGDGTLRATHELAQAARARHLNISIIGIPKTIDNDICFMDKTFGFETAVYATNNIITVAHNEARGAQNGIGLIHVMGRDSGFIAAYASLANTHINFCLIPEEKFQLEEGENALLPALFERLRRRRHSVIIVAEGAGQELITGDREVDKSGNVLHKNIGEFLKSEIKRYAKKVGMEVNIKYFDPTYMIRGVPANGTDAVFCYLLAQNAVHAAFAGKTDMVIGHWSDTFTHVPISMAVRERKKINPEGPLWRSVRLHTWR